jgi:hypothetical protein
MYVTYSVWRNANFDFGHLIEVSQAANSLEKHYGFIIYDTKEQKEQNSSP